MKPTNLSDLLSYLVEVLREHGDVEVQFHIGSGITTDINDAVRLVPYVEIDRDGREWTGDPCLAFCSTGTETKRQK